MKPACVLLITNDEATGRSVHQALSNRATDFKIHVIRDLTMARARIAGGGVDVVLGAVSSDGRFGVTASELAGLCTLTSPPVVALCAPGEDSAGADAVHRGARLYVSYENYAHLPQILDSLVRRIKRRTK